MAKVETARTVAVAGAATATKTSNETPGRDRMRSVLALTIVVGGFVFFVVLWFTPGQGQAAAERAWGLMAGFMAAIVGFYFGHQGIEKAHKEAGQAISKLDESIRTAERGFTMQRDRAEKYRRDVERLLTAIQETTDVDLLQRVDSLQLRIEE